MECGGGEMIATMDLAPITTSELRGRARKWGKELTVTDTNGQNVVEASLARVGKPEVAVFRTAVGEWRIELRKRKWTGKEPEPRWRGWFASRDQVVVDASGSVVAAMRNDRLTLADGETLAWVGPRVWNSLCGLGGDLWVAKGLRPRRRGFRAELSRAMLAREDRELLSGIASIMTQIDLTGNGATPIVDPGGF